MKNIANMYVMQTRIFPPDVIPFRLLITATGATRVIETFGFRDVQWNQENMEYAFQDGTLGREGRGEIVPITWLSFRDRRIIVQVFGDSSAAHAVYAAVSEMLAQLAPDFKEPVPMLFREETSCAAQLDFEWTALLNPKLVDLVTRRVQGLSTEEVGRAIRSVSVRFTIGVAVSEKLRDYAVSSADQTIAIEPRAEVPLSERNYFTYSPCDSDTHLKLVSELEAKLAKKGDRSREW
jgi:hypothetical protein